MRNVSALEREVARSARAKAESTADANAESQSQGTQGHLRARELRHAALNDVVKSVVVWTVCSLFHCGLTWALAHFTVSLHLPKWSTAPAWLLLGVLPVAIAEWILQRSAMGIKLHGISGDGPLKLCGPRAPLPAIVLLPPVPGSPWFGSRRVRLLMSMLTGSTLAALNQFLSPFAAAIGGCVLAVSVLVRAAFATIWICDWRLQQLWRKKT
mmetsp:Transcript_35531/g.57187  ORF Transcript_35531/g.57187 Transcript_35531/m.57187 type:complete len:212 (+) Transcript_35531:50-685(+)